MGNQSLELQQGTGESLSRDTIFSTLSNQRRRYVIHYLKREPGQVRIRDLAEQIAAWENDTTIEQLTYKERKRVYTSLHQTHLPKMDECGIVTYDRDRGIIELASRASELDLYLEVVPQDELPWSEFYLGLAAVSLLLVVVAWANVLQFGGFPPLAYAALIAGVFALAAGVHTYTSRQLRFGSSEVPTEARPRRQTAFESTATENAETSSRNGDDADHDDSDERDGAEVAMFARADDDADR